MRVREGLQVRGVQPERTRERIGRLASAAPRRPAPHEPRRPNHSTKLHLYNCTTLRFHSDPFPTSDDGRPGCPGWYSNAGTGELAAVGTASAGERRTATPCSCSRLPPLMRQWRCGWSLPQGLHRWVPLLLLPWPSSLVVRGQVKWRAGPPRPVSPMPRSHAVPLCAHAAHR